MITLDPFAPQQASNNRLNDLARGIGQGSREMQDQAIQTLLRFFRSSQTLLYTYAHDDAAMLQRGVTGQEAILRTVLEPLDPVLERLRSLSSWLQGWNGADALPPDSWALTYAADWILQLYLVAISRGMRWFEPNVTASADGEVVFEWWHRQRKLTVYISGESATYVRVWGPDIETEMAEGEIASMRDQDTQWRWLIG